jgi:hypothetical protein
MHHSSRISSRKHSEISVRFYFYFCFDRSKKGWSSAESKLFCFRSTQIHDAFSLPDYLLNVICVDEQKVIKLNQFKKLS